VKAITLRNIPAAVQKAIRTKAREKRISANKAVIELLEERVGVASQRTKLVHHDLDEFAGSWSAEEAKEFDKFLKTARRVDSDLWK